MLGSRLCVQAPGLRCTRGAAHSVIRAGRVVCRRPQHIAAAAAAAGVTPAAPLGKWQPLLGLVLVETQAFFAKQLPGKCFTEDQLLDMLKEPQLMACPELYGHLNGFLRTLKVRTVIGCEARKLTRGISYIDPRCPRHITHANRLAEAGLAGAASVTTCAEAVSCSGHQLRYPDLFCVAILHRPWRDKPVLCDRYKTYPVECCVYDASWVTPLRNTPGDEEWALGPQQLRMPPWVAAWWAASTHAASEHSGAAAAAAAATTQGVPPQRTSRPLTAEDSTTAAGSETRLSSVCSSSSSSHGSADCTPFNKDSFVSFRVGLLSWGNLLFPTDEEREFMHAAVLGVQLAAAAACKGREWSVASVAPVGSFKKNTSLRNAHDLDLMLELHNSPSRLETDRLECLDSIHTALCAPAASTDAARWERTPTGGLPAAQSGWQLVSHRSSPHWLRLFHPELKIRLDLQVSPCLHAFGYPAAATGQWRRCVVQHILQRARSEQLGETAPPDRGALLESYTRPSAASRECATMLTPLLNELVKGSDTRFEEEYGLTGAGGLVTFTVRVLKAWSKGLEFSRALGASAAEGSSAAASQDGVSSSSAAEGSAQGPNQLRTAEDPFKGTPVRPPGYVWEILVLFVLERELRQGRAAGQTAESRYPTAVRTVAFFLDVLLAASQLLRPAAPGRAQPLQPIAVTHFYTAEECEMFRAAWGPPGLLCTPYIIHPADPRFNCTTHTGFSNWAAIADAAGRLHKQLQQLLQSPPDRSGKKQGGAAGSSGSSSAGLGGRGSSGVDVWQLVMDTTSLGPAVRAFSGGS